ncbi:MAG: hypothetical protein JWN98_1462, partial [Abditibacteriota bacterium]|nr:hypothetical protein [Abditibacteriota bacterium]
MAIELKVPRVGESISEVQIGEWLKKEGDAIRDGETLVMLDTEKTTVELPAPQSGVLVKILKQPGDIAGIEEVIALLEDAGAAPQTAQSTSSVTAAATPSAANSAAENNAAAGMAPATTPSAQPAQKADEKPAAPASNGNQSTSTPSFVMPAAERELAQRGLSAEQVAASGPGGRLLKEDVLRHEAQTSQPTAQASTPRVPAPQAQASPVQTSQAQTAAPEPEARADEEVVPMTMLRRKIAEHLVRAQQEAALLTTFNEIDMSAVMALRKEHQESFQKKYNIKLGFMSFFIKASIDALKLYPG